MAGLVAIFARTGALGGAETRAAIAAYQRVRGTGAATELAAGDWGSVAVLASPAAAPAAIAGGAERWEAVVGDRHATTLADGLHEGQFASAAFDGTAVTVRNDPFGMQLVYWAQTPERWLLCTSATVLAGLLGAEPDPVGISVYLRAGYQCGPATHWRGVTRLDPASELAFTPGRMRRRTYWQPDVDRRLRSGSLRGGVDACARALAIAVERYAERELVADLTGGLDSRMVVAAILSRGRRPAVATNGPAAGRDAQLARRLGEAAGLRWRSLELAEDWVERAPRAFEKARRWSDGALDAFQLAEVFDGYDRRRELGFDAAVGGGGGEHLAHYPWMSQPLRAGRSGVADADQAVRVRFLAAVDESWLDPDVARTAHAYLVAALTGAARPYHGMTVATQLDAMYRYKSVGHFGAYRSAAEAALASLVPCYHREVFLAGFSARHSHRNNHRLQRAVIHELSPVLASLPTFRGGPAEPMTLANAHRFVPYFAYMTRKALIKFGGRAAPPAAAQRWVARGREAMLAAAIGDGLLAPGALRSGAFVDEQRVAEALAGSAPRDWTALGRIVSVESALALAGARPPPRADPPAGRPA